MKFTKTVVLSIILAVLVSGSCLAAAPYDVSGIDLRVFLNTFRLGQVPSWDKYSPRSSIVDRDNTRHTFSLDRKGDVNIALWTHNVSGEIQTIAIHNDFTGMYLAEWTDLINQLYDSPTIIEDGGNYYNPAAMRLWDVRMGASMSGSVSISSRMQETEMRLNVRK